MTDKFLKMVDKDLERFIATGIPVPPKVKSAEDWERLVRVFAEELDRQGIHEGNYARHSLNAWRNSYGFPRVRDFFNGDKDKVIEL